MGKRKDRLDHARHVDIWKEAHIYPMAEFRRVGCDRLDMCKWRDKVEATRKILQMAVDGKRNQGRTNLSWRDLYSEKGFGKKPDDN